MKHTLGYTALIVAMGTGLLVAGCAPAENAKLAAAAASPAGQLFCAVHGVTGPMVAGIIDAEASAMVPFAAPVVVLAMGAAKSYVDAVCAKAGGIAVSPPPVPAAAPQIAVKVAGA